MQKNAKFYYLISLIGGFLYALGFPSFLEKTFLPLTLVGFLCYLYSFFRLSLYKQKITALLLFSFTFNLTGFYWIPETLKEFGEMPYFLALTLSFFFSLIIVPHLWLLILVHFIKTKKKISFGLYQIPLWAYLFTLAETFTPAQFPTAIGQIYILYPELVNLAHIGGVSLYSFITYIVLISIVLKPNFKTMKVMLSLFIIASYLISKPNSKKIDELNIQVVQANVGNFMKVRSEQGDDNSMAAIFDRYQTLSRPSMDSIDLIVWPETAYPESLFLNTPIERTMVPPLIQKIIADNKIPMVIGGYSNRASIFSSYETEYNSVLYFNTEGKLTQYYHKMILIPFGETLPFPKIVRKELAKYITNVSYFAKGDSFNALKTNKGYQFITPVCYELLKPYFLRDFLNEQKSPTHFMINLTNDSWYGNTAEPEQHLFLSRWRALEFNIPIVRSTNTGITTLINPDGTLDKRLEIGQKDKILFKVPITERSKTFYENNGFLATVLTFLLTLLMNWIENRLLINREA